MCSVKNSDSQDKNGKIQKKGTDVTSNRPTMVLWPTGLLNLLPGQVPVWKHMTAKLYSLKLSSLSVIGVFWYLSAFDCCTAILIWNCDMWFLTIKEYSLKEFHCFLFHHSSAPCLQFVHSLCGGRVQLKILGLRIKYGK